MNLRKRNIRLLNLLGFLILASLVLFFIPKEKKSTLEDVALFQLADTSAIDKITVESEDLSNALVRTDTGWIINNKMEADENIMRVLLTVMKQVEVLRPIPESQLPEVAKAFEESALSVNFFVEDEVVESFRAGSNETKTLSIFKSDEGYYVVNLPGYDSFVTGIFEISEIDWKDRMIVSVTPTSLSRMSVHFYDDPDKDFSVEVVNNMPLIPGMEQLDTLKLMDYLDQFLYFQADRYVDLTKDAKYDSLAQTEPFVKFSFLDLHGNTSIVFYPKIAGETEQLGITNEGERALFDERRIRGIFRARDFFKKE